MKTAFKIVFAINVALLALAWLLSRNDKNSDDEQQSAFGWIFAAVVCVVLDLSLFLTWFLRWLF